MKSQDEIVAQMKTVEKDDWIGAIRGELLNALDFAHAKPFLKDDVTADQWLTPYKSVEDVKQAIIDYLPFAWEKANNCRGISASRSVDHMRGLFWLLGRDDMLAKFDDHYEFYGKPCLVLASVEVGFDWAAHDDGKWRNDEGDHYITAERGLAKHGISVPVPDGTETSGQAGKMTKRARMIRKHGLTLNRQPNDRG
jgi:hypothetical protein